MCRVVNVFTVQNSMHRNSDEAESLLSTACVELGWIVCRTLWGLQCIVHIFGRCTEYEIFRYQSVSVFHSAFSFGFWFKCFCFLISSSCNYHLSPQHYHCNQRTNQRPELYSTGRASHHYSLGKGRHSNRSRQESALRDCHKRQRRWGYLNPDGESHSVGKSKSNCKFWKCCTEINFLVTLSLFCLAQASWARRLGFLFMPCYQFLWRR